jgi:hypothetical protein
LLVLASVGITLLAFYLTWVSHHVEYPADILMWAEGDFVNDIIKFRVGYPLYTLQENNDSFHYTRGARQGRRLLAEQEVTSLERLSPPFKM